MDLYVGSFWGNRQWGLGNPSINFPIAFPKECFIAAITRAAGNYEHSIVITTKNKTNLSWICKGYDNSAGNTYANWLALGCQLQWGFEETETKTIAFPISFESIKYVFLSKIYGPASGGADTVAYNFFRKSLTGVSFDYAYTRNWLAIGGQ